MFTDKSNSNKTKVHFFLDFSCHVLFKLHFFSNNNITFFGSSFALFLWGHEPRRWASSCSLGSSELPTRLGGTIDLGEPLPLVEDQGTRLPDYPRVPGHFSGTRNRLLRFSYYPEPTRTRVHYPEGTRRVTERLKGRYFPQKYSLFSSKICTFPL